MKQIISRIILPTFVGLLLMFGQSGMASAACTASGAKGEVLQGVGQTGSNCSDEGVNKTVETAVNILSYIVGIAAVIMIIIAGFKYITSNGDSNGIANAKNTLIYAIVGLAVAALAQILVRIVLSNVRP